MNLTIYRVEEMPRCKTCNKKMEYWIFGQKEYECNECTAKGISDSMISILEKNLAKLN
jgi:tRNA(Ile2) C34 agmatinyltransferase TiaS